MNKKILLVLGLSLALILSGCIGPEPGPSGPACGNGSCEAGETAENCIEDCAEPPMPPVPGGDESSQPPNLPF